MEGTLEGIIEGEIPIEGIYEGSNEGETILQTPLPPTNIIASDGEYYGYVFISWDMSNSYGKNYEYEIFRNKEYDCDTAVSIGKTTFPYLYDTTAESPITKNHFSCLGERKTPVIYFYWVRVREKKGEIFSNWSICSYPDRGWRGE